MFNPTQLEEMAKKLADAIPAGFAEFPEEGKKQVQLNLQRVLERMEMVSREEFDVQKAVLAKTRSKLEALEARLSELEGQKSQ
ncbi:Ubiquinone biosynthesis accessory factor UbiK [uncultured Thiomicrorhabdus sp.]